jgi:hypothetical protein
MLSIQDMPGMPLLEPATNIKSVVEDIVRCQTTRNPLSVIRLGDGEGAVLGYGRYFSLDDINTNLRIWFHDQPVTEAVVLELQSDLLRAIKSADIIGIPNIRRQRRERFCYAISVCLPSIFEKSELEVPKYADAALHQFLQFGLFFNFFLRGQDYCGVISSRNLELPIKEAFNVKKVELFEIPGCSMAPNGMNAKASHYPERFNELRRALKVPFHGAPFLIGAGLFGKTYCKWIKERGGIALDVGSLLDGWAGLSTRPRQLKYPHIYRLDSYKKFPMPSWSDAISRYNSICKELSVPASVLS